jgi:DnaJ-class molecular chaperone
MKKIISILTIFVFIILIFASTESKGDTCKWCKGSGKVTCVNCSGITSYECNLCNHTGKRDCRDCGGDGTIEKDDYGYKYK